ncbi:hypothetical protein COEREDRAFT_48379 [Coemansia reversa NRRL 1564]|uniref:Uncharacterized protein n=1 Tax=Coemansia reversa (strain ATCC 12441 / NRRL 1564) TaxID=763665 RepID=A0A2G5B3Y4_COERN|nr:hypothetical protein COEREDRAFT_48379 [Coemansia reversa NRRL 1564]|eukprot:PIA13712.1 hypothetical protein COEREDRAFT_48379 [Coemansia reversa NRRL 1564]
MICLLEELQATKGNCVLIDPGRGNLIYCMHKRSTADNPCLYCYSAQTTHKTIDPQRFRRYVEMRNCISPVLRGFYENHQTIESLTHQIHKEHGGFKLHRYPLHWKLQLSVYINQQQADARLARNLREKFGAYPVLVLVIGNWSAPNVRFHAPIRSVGLRDMLQAYRFKVYLIDEYCTMVACPVCYHQLEKFCWLDKPRPWQQKNHPRVLCHGLLRFTSERCSEDNMPNRIWNRDLAAVINMRAILHSLRNDNGIPRAFHRGNNNALAAPQPRHPRTSTSSVSGITNSGSASTSAAF